MGKVLLESVKNPGVTRLFTRYEAKVLTRLGRWRIPAGSAPQAETKPAAPARCAPDARAAFDALVEKHGSLEAAPVRELEDLADAFGFNADAIEGSGAGGNVLKADWIAELKRRHAGPPTGYKRRDLQAE